MKIQLDDYYIFCQVAKYGSMKRASEKTRLPLSTVSRRIVSLEENLGLQLFIRNKNKLSLSNEGVKYYQKLASIIEELANTVDELNDDSGLLSGHIVISTTKLFYRQFIHPAILTLLKDNPKLSVELKHSVNSTALTDDVDIAVVNGELPESNLIARKLIELDLAFFANEEFAQQYKDEISNAEFNNLPYISTLSHPSLPITNKSTNEIFKIQPSRKLTVMDAEMLIAATKEGLGYAIIPLYALPPNNNGLVSIFEHYQLAPVPFSLLYRSRQLQSAAQRAVVDAIVNAFK
ncbi:LysR family transcriptional regulator [Shewanella goraebulensis]|uniref:LysR family transcriptional regulator n=1 Tax=Shewanella goraebulensis TaxID=3050637 RepID=UPI00255169D5|nr:LysR family transcriptional regulator [Shewanella goraebulensis]